MYFPDNFAGLTALSERVHRFVLQWAHRQRTKRRRFVKPQAVGLTRSVGRVRGHPCVCGSRRFAGPVESGVVKPSRPSRNVRPS